MCAQASPCHFLGFSLLIYTVKKLDYLIPVVFWVLFSSPSPSKFIIRPIYFTVVILLLILLSLVRAWEAEWFLPLRVYFVLFITGVERSVAQTKFCFSLARNYWTPHENIKESLFGVLCDLSGFCLHFKKKKKEAQSWSCRFFFPTLWLISAFHLYNFTFQC